MLCDGHCDPASAGLCCLLTAHLGELIKPMSPANMLPNLQHWFSPSVSQRLQQLCKTAMQSQPWSRPFPVSCSGVGCQQQRFLRRGVVVQCIKPGTRPEEVVRRIDKGICRIWLLQPGRCIAPELGSAGYVIVPG